jgi:hypothetical protein
VAPPPPRIPNQFPPTPSPNTISRPSIKGISPALIPRPSFSPPTVALHDSGSPRVLWCAPCTECRPRQGGPKGAVRHDVSCTVHRDARSCRRQQAPSPLREHDLRSPLFSSPLLSPLLSSPLLSSLLLYSCLLSSRLFFSDLLSTFHLVPSIGHASSGTLCRARRVVQGGSTAGPSPPPRLEVWAGWGGTRCTTRRARHVV